MELAAKLDDYGKPAWIAVMVLSFIVFWPIGLAILGYLLWSGRMGCWKNGGGAGRWHRHCKPRERSGESWFGGGGQRTSGNTAFDEYREETLRRLEEEQEEFQTFLHRLREAKDKAEFDQFMAEQRKRRASNPPPNTDPDGPTAQPAG